MLQFRRAGRHVSLCSCWWRRDDVFLQVPTSTSRRWRACSSAEVWFCPAPTTGRSNCGTWRPEPGCETWWRCRAEDQVRTSGRDLSFRSFSLVWSLVVHRTVLEPVQYLIQVFLVPLFWRCNQMLHVHDANRQWRDETSWSDSQCQIYVCRKETWRWNLSLVCRNTRKQTQEVKTLVYNWAMKQNRSSVRSSRRHRSVFEQLSESWILFCLYLHFEG